MNPGTLDRKIQIQRQANGLPMVTAAGVLMVTVDGQQMTTGSRKGRLGQDLDAWGLWKNRMASKKSLSGGEGSEGDRELGRQSVRFRIRFTAGLTMIDRIVYDGHAYDIVNIEEIGRRAMHDISCVLHANTRPAT